MIKPRSFRDARACEPPTPVGGGGGLGRTPASPPPPPKALDHVSEILRPPRLPRTRGSGYRRNDQKITDFRGTGGTFALRARCALLLDYVPPEEPPSTPLRNALRIR